MRLNKFLASVGLGSRRSTEVLITSGAVSINGRFVTSLATQVEDGDDVRVNGRQVRQARHVYIIINKPRGLVVTHSDEKGRRTIYDQLPKGCSTLFHVGRLDKDSEGLLLLTNDGDLAQSLTHPKHAVEKEYEVLLDKPFDPAHADKLLRGITIEGGRGRFEKLRIAGPAAIVVVLKQGLKRQIRLMLYDRGYEVKRLKRVRIGPIRLKGLGPGAFRELNGEEIASLKLQVKPSVQRKFSD